LYFVKLIKNKKSLIEFELRIFFSYFLAKAV
jgi:hypothetical protein